MYSTQCVSFQICAKFENFWFKKHWCLVITSKSFVFNAIWDLILELRRFWNFWYKNTICVNKLRRICVIRRNYGSHIASKIKFDAICCFFLKLQYTTCRHTHIHFSNEFIHKQPLSITTILIIISQINTNLTKFKLSHQITPIFIDLTNSSNFTNITKYK